MLDKYTKENAEKLARADDFNKRTIAILEMIAIGAPTSEVYDAIALLYESRHPGMRCSMLELEDGILLHGGAPSMPKAYCEAVHGLPNGPNVGSCGVATYTGERFIVENIETHPNWADIKQYALPHGMRCCWSEPIKNSHGKVLGAFGMYYDYPASPTQEESDDLTSAARLAGLVMERDHNQKKIRELAYVDTLTKLPSRARLFQYMEDLINSAKHHNRSFNLLFLDLDDFKYINDTQGHECGDKLLKTIADRIACICEKTDFIARLGGDEFCIITESEIADNDTDNLATKCIEAVSQVLVLDNIKYSPNCSIGIAKFPDDGSTTSSLLKAADIALYKAKDLGKNRYGLYEQTLMEEAEYKFYFEKALKDALENEEIYLVYQPKVNTKFHRVVGVEALARWEHPKLGPVSPQEFISVAEKMGIIKEMTDWILHEACRQTAQWEKTSGLKLKIAVNISPSLFLNRDIIELVKRVLDDTGIDPSILELEVTENVVQTSPENLSIFEEIKSLGVSLAIDDFGVGYSSFASLKHIKIDCIKIDRYFIGDMLQDEHSKYLISSMIDIGKNFGYEIVAEGVESKQELALLEDLGCHYIQGFHFCKPIEGDKLLAWVRAYEHE